MRLNCGVTNTEIEDMQIKISNLSKVFPNGHRALDDLDLEISSGMFGLLGPNGAGKTTLMRILVTLLDPTSGNVSMDGFDLKHNRSEIRKLLGYLPQDFASFSKLATWEFLDYMAKLAGMKNKKERQAAVDHMLEQVGLFDVRDRLANKLSGGMKRRLGIAQALIGDPKIIVVDEPTTGLDPEERIRFRNLLTDLGREDRIIILSTHIVGDISSTCESLALINHGKVAFQGSPGKLVEMARGHVWEMTVPLNERDMIEEKFAVISAIPGARGWNLTVVADKMDGYDATEVEPNLEHAYVHFLENVTEDGNLDGAGLLPTSGGNEDPAGGDNQ